MIRVTPVQRKESFRDRQGITSAGRAVVRLNHQPEIKPVSRQEGFTESERLHLAIVTRLVEGGRLLAPQMVIEQSVGEVIMEAVGKSDYETPVEVELARDIYFEVTYNEDGDRVFSLRIREPKRSPLVERYVAETALVS